MIDKQRLEKALAQLDIEDYAVGSDRGKTFVDGRFYRALLTDDLAMRGIVEALAARRPFLIESQTGEWWYDCAACGESSQESPDAIEHEDDCLWVKARALVGPASDESNPIEFEGVGEETE